MEEQLLIMGTGRWDEMRAQVRGGEKKRARVGEGGEGAVQGGQGKAMEEQLQIMGNDRWRGGEGSRWEAKRPAC